MKWWWKHLGLRYSLLDCTFCRCIILHVWQSVATKVSRSHSNVAELESARLIQAHTARYAYYDNLDKQKYKRWPPSHSDAIQIFFTFKLSPSVSSCVLQRLCWVRRSKWLPSLANLLNDIKLFSPENPLWSCTHNPFLDLSWHSCPVYSSRTRPSRPLIPACRQSMPSMPNHIASFSD